MVWKSNKIKEKEKEKEKKKKKKKKKKITVPTSPILFSAIRELIIPWALKERDKK